MAARQLTTLFYLFEVSDRLSFCCLKTVNGTLTKKEVTRKFMTLISCNILTMMGYFHVLEFLKMLLCKI